MEERNGILSLFPVKKPILGMIHLKGESDTEIFEKAKEIGRASCRERVSA